MEGDRTAGQAQDLPLREQLQALINAHGRVAVYEALITIIRRDALGKAARKLNLIPHTVGQEEIKRRTN